MAQVEGTSSQSLILPLLERGEETIIWFHSESWFLQLRSLDEQHWAHTLLSEPATTVSERD